MHNNFFFLRQLSGELAKALDGYTLVSCFSQTRDELVIEFNNSHQSFYIKASLQPDFCCLSFPSSFQRARKNSVDLFHPVLMHRVVAVRQFNNERSFLIELTHQKGLLFKMQGNRANVLFTAGDRVQEIFRNHLQADLDLIPSSLDRPLDWSKENFLVHRHQLLQSYFTLGKPVKIYLEESGFFNRPEGEQWQVWQQVIDVLDNPKFFITRWHQQLFLSLLPFGDIQHTFESPIAALNEFFLLYSQTTAFSKQKNQLAAQLTVRIRNTEAYLEKSKRKLGELATDHHWQIWGDLVMANLHRIKTGEKVLTTENFYDDNRPVEIPLKELLSPQKNAEVFYRKGKNTQIEIEKLTEAVLKKEAELAALNETLRQTLEATSVKDLKAPRTRVEGEQGPRLPYREFEFDHYKIWVGRDAQSNDELTLKYSYKEDLWLHAKDVAGSHVLIKHQAGKNFPKEVIERAAQLAAHYSKRKTESLCPVAMTPKKFVRKRKGDPAGTVVVEREEVILVEPKP